ncbi:nucleotide-binding domain-containing protein [Ramicandelaber brevisporus]|nr:nucleotide-binding domain-containing protein [Ramicandelaber brevisporus]
MPAAASKPRAIVVGAGVVGLTTALVLARRRIFTGGIHILAAHLPGDIDAMYYASPWAGAHWRSMADSSEPQTVQFDRDTLFELQRLATTLPHTETGLLMAPGKEYWEKRPKDVRPPWYSSILPGYAEIPASDLPAGVEYGIRYETVLIDSPSYLKYLVRELTALGVTFEKRAISHLSDSVPADAHAGVVTIVNCTGLGAAKIGGVNDGNRLYPTRGQTVHVRAPFHKVSDTITMNHANGILDYYIPRAKSGIVICGGTFQQHNVREQPDKETSERILRNNLALAPGLSKDGTLEGIEVVKEAVGMRPTRLGGIRCEASTRVKKYDDGGRAQSAIIYAHNYGHGGGGYQGSWGSAFAVASAIERELNSLNISLSSKL